MIPRPPRSALFPSTTLVRSQRHVELADMHALGMLVELGAAGAAADRDQFRQPLQQPLGDRAEARALGQGDARSEEHTCELQSRQYLVCRLLVEKKKQTS